MTRLPGSSQLQIIAVALAWALLAPTTLVVAQGRVATLIRELGVGADVVVQPYHGEEVRGVIRAIHGDGFDVAVDRGQVRRSAFEDVRTVTLARMTYTARGETDPLAVRRILTVMGRGHGVEVKTKDARRLRGRLRDFDGAQLTVELQDSPSLVQLTYDQVAEIRGKSLSGGQKAGIWTTVVGGAIGGGFLIYWLALCANEGC